MKIASVVALGGLVAPLIAARDHTVQLAPPGPAGVVMGHLHLTARDGAEGRKFWTAMGGAAVQNGTLQLIQFPGTFVMIRQGQPTAGSAGSTVDHLTFRVRDLNQLAKDGIIPNAGVITTADGILINVVEDKSVEGAARFESMTITTVAPAETQAWYVKQFGAAAGKSAAVTATLPGVRLEFNKADAAPAGTRGRALDHIGFEVKNLEEFCKKLEASGIKFDRPFTRLPNSTTAIAFLTDPWGTYIELTENLAPAK
jgi:extradiol dioxygenase family protein